MMTHEVHNKAAKPKPRRPGGESNDRLDALTRAQIELTERMNTLTRDIATIGVRFDQMAVVTNEQLRTSAEQIKTLVEQVAAMASAQMRTDEQMRLLVGDARPGLKSEGADAELPDSPKVPEITAWLRLSENTIYGWAREGRIPCKKAGRSYIFNKAALIEWARNAPQ